MSGKRHLAWAGATLTLAALGFGLGRLESEPGERPVPPAPSRTAAAPLARPSSPPARRAALESPSPSPMTTSAPELRGQKRPGTAALWRPPALDPDALRLAQLLSAFRDPRRPPEEFTEVLRQLLDELDEPEQLEFLAAWANFGEVGSLCESYADGSAALPLLRWLYGLRPDQDSFERLVVALEYLPYEELDPALLRALAQDWPEDSRPRFLLEEHLRAQRVAARRPSPDEASSTDASEEAWEEPRAEEETLSIPALYSEFALDPDLEGLADAYREDPAGLRAWFATQEGPRWKAISLLVRVEAAPPGSPDEVALRSLKAGDWRHLEAAHRLELVLILEKGSVTTTLEQEILRSVAADEDLDLEAARGWLSSRARFLLSLVSRQRSDWEGVPQLVEDYLALLEEGPFVARRLLPALLEVCGTLPLGEGLQLAAAFQFAGDARRAEEVLRRCEPGPKLLAARDHLAGGHSLGQFREWEVRDE